MSNGADEREGPQDPVNNIPDPDEWRERDGHGEVYEPPLSSEERYQTNYLYIQAVHYKRMADAVEGVEQAIKDLRKETRYQGR